MALASPADKHAIERISPARCHIQSYGDGLSVGPDVLYSHVLVHCCSFSLCRSFLANKPLPSPLISPFLANMPRFKPDPIYTVPVQTLI